MNTPTLHPADRLRRSGDGNIALGQMEHAICDEHARIVRDLGQQNADMWLEALCSLLGGMVEPVRDDGDDDGCVEVACTRCGKGCCDFRRHGDERVCICCVDDELDDVRRILDVEKAQHDATDAEVRRLRALDESHDEELTARDATIERLTRERDEARAEVERLRAEVSSLRERLDEADEWAPPIGWLVRTETRDSTVYALWERAGYTVTHKTHSPTIYMCDTPNDIGPAVDALREAIEWCEAQMASAPTVGATDAGPDVPALIVEGDAAEGAREARAVPAAPVSGAEQSCVETGVDRPAASDERIVGPREGEEWPFYGSWPYGYQVDDSGDERLLLTDQHEAMVMRLICQWHGDDVKSSEIAARLNRMALANRKGVRWYPAAVRTRIRTSYEEWREVFG